MKRFFILLFIISFGGVAPAMAQGGVKVGLIFDSSIAKDKGINLSASQGLAKAKKKFGIATKEVMPSRKKRSMQVAMRAMAQSGYSLIIAIGKANRNAVKNMAGRYPRISFAIIDSIVNLNNVTSVTFKEHEGSYLVGMIAASRSRVVDGKRVVGFIGPMEIPLIHKYEVGFKQGARKVYPDIDVVANYIGSTPRAFNDPAKAEQIAKAQIAQGASVIYAAAGDSSSGLFNALKQTNGNGPCFPKFQNKRRTDQCVYGISSDYDQNGIVPGQIVTSMLKHVDIAVYQLIEQVKSGRLKGGVQEYGLKNNGVGYSLNQYNKKLLNTKIIKLVDEYKQKIINGKIQVSSVR